MSERLYRDPSRAWIGGVCAGIADQLGLAPLVVRLFTVPLLITPLLPLAVVAYVIAVITIPKRPPPPVEDSEREAFRRAASRAPSATFGEIRHRFRELEHRIRRMEAYVTSTDFEFDQNLGKRGPPPRA